MMPQGEPATVVVASSTDLASKTLADTLIEGQGFESTGIDLLGKPVYQRGPLLLSFFEGPIVSPPDLDSYFNPQAYVFLSRHSAESGIASLTAHAPGNFSDAKFGGAPGELGRADPGLLKDYMVAISKRRGEVPSYQITMEATHHGPTSLSKPVLFVELGSSERHWRDRAAARVVADALIDALTHRGIWEKVAVAFGGTHYPEKFNGMVIDGDFAVSFVAPKYALEHVDERMVRQMIQKTTAPVKYALLDWKGLGPHKEKIVNLVAQFGLEAVKV
jgi:D-aminoacyl-tRNA deacylase